MKEDPNHAPGKQPSLPWRTSAAAAAIFAIMQACLTIEGRGIEGFILWVIILFFGYWLFITFLIWLWRRRRDRG